MHMRGFDQARGLKPAQATPLCSNILSHTTPMPSAAIKPHSLPTAPRFSSQPEPTATNNTPRVESETQSSGPLPLKSNANRNARSAPLDSVAARETMRPPKYGGYSKRDQLGSVNDSWGSEEGAPRLGLFQIEPEPPSPPTSPFPHGH